MRRGLAGLAALALAGATSGCGDEQTAAAYHGDDPLPNGKTVGQQIEARQHNLKDLGGANKLMAELTAMALACNQTKVFNVVHTSATSEAYLPGDSSIYHLQTHDEPVDSKLGYQAISSKLAELAFRGCGDFVRALDGIKEGDGALLDNTIMLGFSDTGYAKIHQPTTSRCSSQATAAGSTRAVCMWSAMATR